MFFIFLRISLIISFLLEATFSCRTVRYHNEISSKVRTDYHAQLFFSEKRGPLFPVYNEKQGCSCGLLSGSSGNTSRPWAGIVSSSINHQDTFGHSCSASLINHKYIISSASCICQLLQKKCIDKHISKYFYFEPPEKSLRVRFPFAAKPNETTFYIKGCYIHGLYNSSKGSEDIALLSLSERIASFEQGVLQPICLPAQNDVFQDLDCEIDARVNDINEENQGHRIKCGFSTNPSNHSYITSFKSTSTSSLPCLTNSFGPMKYEPCISKFLNFSACQQFRSPFSVPQSQQCIDALRYLNETSSNNTSLMFVKIKMGNNLEISCPNKGLNASSISSRALGSQSIRNQMKYGWCYTCKNHLSQCRDWGYCSKLCSHKDKGDGPFLLEKPVYTFTSRELGLCGDVRKQFCLTGQLFQAPSIYYDIQTTTTLKSTLETSNTSRKLLDLNVQIPVDNNASRIRRELPYGLIEDLDEYISYSKRDLSQLCDEHSGGSIWKKLDVSVMNEKLELAVLIGIVSRTGRICNETNENVTSKGLPIHTRIHNYLPWILSVSNDGKCKAHKNDLYVDKLNSDNLEASLGLTRQFYCTLELNGTDLSPDLLNPNSNKYGKWLSIFNDLTESLSNIDNYRQIVFFEFLQTPNKNLSASFALITKNKTNVPQLEKEIQLRGLHIQVMMNEVAFGYTPDHLHLSWKWSGSELNIIVKERSISPLLRLSVGVSSQYGHVANMKTGPLQLYRAHVNFKAKAAKVVNVGEKGRITSISSNVETLELSLQEEKKSSWITTFGFQTNNIISLGIHRNSTFCFLIQIHQDIRHLISSSKKFPITSQHCFLDIE